MDAMILAAGRGERLRPITDTIPKVLVPVGGKPLIEYHVEKLAKFGFNKIIINVSYLHDNVINYLGDGQKYGVHIDYSIEHGQPLGTGGGIVNALPLLENEVVLIVNGDIYTEYDYSNLTVSERFNAKMVMVDNPSHNHLGDYSCNEGTLAPLDQNLNSCTYSGMGCFRKSVFQSYPRGFSRLTEIIRPDLLNHKISTEMYSGTWIDVGTAERLKACEKLVRQSQNSEDSR